MRRTALLGYRRSGRCVSRKPTRGGKRVGCGRRRQLACLGVCERTFRRYLDRFEDAGIEGLIDRRLEQASHRRAPVDEVMALTEGYRRCHIGWSAMPFLPGIGATGDQFALVFESPAGSVLDSPDNLPKGRRSTLR